MKKLLIALAVSTLVLSGCGLFGTHEAWKQAKQENPLQIPPDMDRPSTSAALTIPPPSNAQAESAPTTAPSMANSTSLALPDDVDTAYKRVGLVLQSGDLGTVTAQDAAQHTYELSVSTTPQMGQSQGFLKKHFSNLNQPQSDGGNAGSASGNADASVVTLKVAPGKKGGSIVSATGETKQALHVISVLRGRLGG